MSRRRHIKDEILGMKWLRISLTNKLCIRSIRATEQKVVKIELQKTLASYKYLTWLRQEIPKMSVYKPHLKSIPPCMDVSLRCQPHKKFLLLSISNLAEPTSLGSHTWAHNLSHTWDDRRRKKKKSNGGKGCYMLYFSTFCVFLHLITSSNSLTCTSARQSIFGIVDRRPI